MKISNKVIVILGPTAVGKTKFAVNLAHQFSGEIISADSRQVYIGMDIGTGKDLADYNINNTSIQSHLIDVVKPNCEFNLFLFQKLFYSIQNEIISRNNLPFLVGGTGLYLSSILQKYSLQPIDFESERAKELNHFPEEKLIEILKTLNPKLHNSTDLKIKDRIIKAILIGESREKTVNEFDNLEFLVLGIHEERDVLKKRIRERLKSRLNSGMIKEVEILLQKGITHEKLKFFGLEYKYVSQYLEKELNFNDMQQKLASDIIQFSKRQMTWFRKMEKEGVSINWLKNNELAKAAALIRTFIN